ncbi:MAG: hypothetical protein R3B90_17065 [Planctomycetaceae bacterium]
MTDAYQRAEEGDRDFERKYLLGITDMLATRWPGTKLASRAHMSAGKLLRSTGDYLEAANTFLQVARRGGSRHRRLARRFVVSRTVRDGIRPGRRIATDR